MGRDLASTSGSDGALTAARATLRTDGGARGNPGPAGAGFVLEAADGSIMAEGGRFLGETTNNVAEYEALIWGLETAEGLGVRRVLVLSDSELVVRQVTGVYRVKHANMRPLFVRTMQLLRQFEAYEVRHVRRAENVEADRLVNEAIDVRGQVGDAIATVSEPDQPALFD